MAADGNWNLVIETPMGERQATLSVQTEAACSRAANPPKAVQWTSLTALQMGTKYPGRSPLPTRWT
jgi:hypothetical protein